jgi:signal transduction histidine kinase
MTHDQDLARGIAERRGPPTETADSAAEIAQDQAGRIQALGAMAAEIAHEFNNLMTIVIGSLEQLRRQNLDERGQEQLRRADWGARQAGRVTQRVLSFAHREAREEPAIDLNQVVTNFDRMIQLVAGRNVDVAMELAQHPLPARLLPAQLELALLNLVRNSVDAMDGSGRLVVRTAGYFIDGLGAQSTVEVSVTDTGSGMPPDVVERATGSFFSTKGKGQGIGLGLWMVQRFMVSCGGRLAIDTAIGQGTTVRLIFPRSAGAANGSS